MAQPFGEKRKTRSQEELATEKALKLEDMKARLEHMENAVDTINSTLESKLSNIEQRLRNFAYKRKSESEMEALALTSKQTCESYCKNYCNQCRGD